MHICTLVIMNRAARLLLCVPHPLLISRRRNSMERHLASIRGGDARHDAGRIVGMSVGPQRPCRGEGSSRAGGSTAAPKSQQESPCGRVKASANQRGEANLADAPYGRCVRQGWDFEGFFKPQGRDSRRSRTLPHSRPQQWTRARIGFSPAPRRVTPLRRNFCS